MKNSRQMERHFKGVANHWRIEILLLVKMNDGITLEDVANGLNGNFKTISEHTRKLVQSGLLEKKYVGRMVTHSLTPYGKEFVKFIQTFQ